MISVKVVFTGWERKRVQVGRAIDKADARAQQDAARQTRTAASKMARERLNLKKKEVDKSLQVKRRDIGRWEFRAAYEQVAAHRFGAYKPPSRTAQGRARYMQVRFHRGRALVRFRKGFTVQRGGTQVAIQRRGRARYPLVGITGPSVHGELVDRQPQLRRLGHAAYARRSRYHKDRALARIR